MVRYEIRPADGLSAAERAAWTGLLGLSSAAPSPYLTPEFFDGVAAVTASARVLVGIQAGVPVLFFPFHASAAGGVVGRLLGLGRPIGGPVCDFQGLIIRPDVRIDANALMLAAGLNLMPVKHMAAADAARLGMNSEPQPFHVIDLTAGFDSWEAQQTHAHKHAFRDMRTRLKKAEKFSGGLDLRFHDAGPESFAAMLAWKGAQFAATGQIDVLRIGWVRALLDELRQRSGPALQAQISSLRIGGKLAAVHLGLRTPTTLHYWFPAYDASLRDLSPGNLLLYMMARAAAAEGVRQIHLGASDNRYKQVFANASLPVASGLVLAPTLPGRVVDAGRKAMSVIERALPATLAALPGAALRRLDRRLAFQAL